MKIYLNSVDKVKDFVTQLSKFEDNVDLVSGRYMVDAKSILGIFSLDLSKPIEVVMGEQTSENIKQILKSYAI